MARNLAPAMSIRIPLRIRIRIFLFVACVRIAKLPALLLLRHNRQITNNGQLDYPASANTLHGSVARGVAEVKHVPGNLSMGRKYKRLIDDITDIDNVRDAYYKTRKGKRKSFGYLEFREYAELNIANLAEEMASGVYVRGEYRNFYIYEPKQRLISALPFRDRVAQHAINNVIEPIFERTFLPYTFACRPGKGTHAGVKHVQSETRKTGRSYALKADIRAYFPSIDRPTLHRRIERKIHCKQTRGLIRASIPAEGVGMAIGSLLSQLFANVYGSMLDDFIHHTIKPVAWARYMDDFVIFGDDPSQLREHKHRIEDFLREQMRMQYSKWSVSPVSRGINFLGYRIWPTHKLLRKQSVRDAKRKIVHYRKNGQEEKLRAFLGAWLGHAMWADSYNLKQALEVQK